MEPPCPHVLVLPAPAQGHVTPMLTFSHLLAARGVVVTFVNTEKVQERMLLSSEDGKGGAEGELQTTKKGKENSGIRFVSMPDGSQEPLPGVQSTFCMNSMVILLEGLESQQGVIEEMVVSSRATALPITCIIADAFFPWTVPIATKLGIQRVAFWTSNGTNLAFVSEIQSGKLKVPDSGNGEAVEMKAGELTAGVPIAPSEFFSRMPRDPERKKMIMEIMSGLKETTFLVLSTFEELEASSLEACASCGTKVYSVGPLVPLGDREGDSRVSFYKQESSCIEWLDKQAAGSVLYVSFGSVASLAPQELEELASGIEESEQVFLWVVRDGAEKLPAGFLDRTRDRGLVVNWAPQAKVLEHDAVGAFLTHCGWNSVLESFDTGVPLLCYPIMNDQHVNALLITRIWKVGIALSKDEQKEVITREEIRRGVSSVLLSKELHVNMLAWKGRAQSSLKQGGSSYYALEQIVETLRSVI